MAWIVVAAVVVGEFIAGSDAFEAGDNPDLPVLAQQNPIGPAPAVIDPRRTVALVETIDVAAIAELHYGGCSLRGTPCSLRIVNNGTPVFDNLDAPRNAFVGEDAAAGDVRGPDQQRIAGLESALVASRHGLSDRLTRARRRFVGRRSKRASGRRPPPHGAGLTPSALFAGDFVPLVAQLLLQLLDPARGVLLHLHERGTRAGVITVAQIEGGEERAAAGAHLWCNVAHARCSGARTRTH